LKCRGFAELPVYRVYNGLRIIGATRRRAIYCLKVGSGVESYWVNLGAWLSVSDGSHFGRNKAGEGLLGLGSVGTDSKADPI